LVAAVSDFELPVVSDYLHFLLILLHAAGVPMEEKNWPPFFPLIHHDIANEIPANVQKLQYLAFASWLGMFAWNILLYQ
jgi:hypothetical protein